MSIITHYLYSQGDSGGALLAQDKELQGWAAVGLVSYQPGIRYCSGIYDMYSIPCIQVWG